MSLPNQPDASCYALSAQKMNSTELSILNVMLPSILQNRVPRLPSLRKSVNELRKRSWNLPRRLSEASLEAGTPPPRYTSTAQTATGTPRDGPGAEDIGCHKETDRDSRPSTSASCPTLPSFLTPGIESGINWKYAKQGLSLMSQAAEESRSLAQDPNDSLPSLTRQLYIHGLTYLLHGLPTDMTKEEHLSLRAALPSETLALADCRVVRRDSRDAEEERAVVKWSHSTQEPPSLLHRLVASGIVQFFIFIHFVLPYVKLFASQVYRYERDHRISEKVFNTSIRTIDEVSKRTMAATSAICQMNDGKVGQAINDLALWWIRSVTGGIHEGVSQGVVVLSKDSMAGTRLRANGS